MLAVSVSLLMLAWHMPSDVIGGWFVAAFWMSLSVAALRGERATVALARATQLPPRPKRPLARALGLSPEAPWRARATTGAPRPCAACSPLAARLRMNSRSESRFR